MIATDQTLNPIPVSPDELERIADKHNVGVSEVGRYFYAVVTDRATDTVTIYRAPSGAVVGEGVAS